MSNSTLLSNTCSSATQTLSRLAVSLCDHLCSLRFAAPITHVYNPLEYAREGWEQYVGKYSRAGVEAVLVGMNPGPWGMAQTGVPFGEVNIVRDWLRIDAVIGKPKREHPKRPVEGLRCPRSEVSGARLWGWAQARFGTPQRFFARFFVYNYCPLMFLEASGRNFPPDKLRAAEGQGLFEICDEALRQTIAALSPKYVIGIGGFAEGRIMVALRMTPVANRRPTGPLPHGRGTDGIDSPTANDADHPTAPLPHGRGSEKIAPLPHGRGSKKIAPLPHGRGSDRRGSERDGPLLDRRGTDRRGSDRIDSPTAEAVGHPIIGRILHPSPASPAANRGWAEQAEKDLLACGIKL